MVSSGLVPVPPIKGGAIELYVFKLCEALRRLGIDAYVVDRVWNNSSDNEWIIRVKVPQVVGLDVISRALGRGKSLVLKESLFGLAVAKLIKELNPDIVHANTAWAGYILSHYVKGNFTKFVYTCHNPLWPEESVHLSEKFVRFFEGSAMRRAHAVIAINETMRRAIVKKAGVKPSKVFVVPNGVDTDFFKPGLNCEEITKKYNLEGKYVVLFVGRVTFAKGVHILLKALKLIKERYGLHNIKAIIVGPLSGAYGDDKPSEYVINLQRYALDNNLDVVFTGSVPTDELRYLYSCSHVLVLPSYFEAFPMVLLEAMACGLPVIGSRTGGIVNVIEEGVNGFLFKKGSSHELAKKLYTILSNKTLRRNLAVNNRTIAVSKYSWKVIATRILKVYKLLM